MADYRVGVYNFDPYFSFSTTVGGTYTYTGPSSSEGNATITDDEVGAEGEVLESKSNDENAKADVTIGGNTSTNSKVFAEESWTVMDLTTGETFQVVAFRVDKGDAKGVYTLSEQPLITGHVYETLSIETEPDSDAPETAFTYADYVEDHVIDGTAGNDVIDVDYLGDAEGEVVDGSDNPNDPPVDLEFEWANLGIADNADISAGVGADVGGIQVDVSFVDDSTGSTFQMETSRTQHVDGDTTYNENSALQLTGEGTQLDTSTTTIDFSAVAGSGFNEEVEDVEFYINDIDTGAWQDQVTVRAYDADGNLIDVDFTILGNETISGDTVTGGPGNDSEDEAAGSVRVSIDGPVSSIEIQYQNLGDAFQRLFVTDLHFQGVPVGANDDVIDAGAGNDSIDSGIDSDTVYGGTGDDTINASADDDTLYGGDDADTFVTEDGFGNDTIEGGEGGTDEDVIDASALTSGVDVTFTDSEEGTLTDGTSTATFVEIEEFILTDQADTVDGSAATSAMTIDSGDGSDSILAGNGNDSITSGAGADTVSGGGGADTISAGGGQDTVFGGTGNDSINAGGGADTIYGGTGADTIDGGGGPDLIVLEDTFGADSITGGETGTDNDTLDATAVTSGVTVDFTAAEAGTLTDGTSTATFSEIETFDLTDQADTVTGADATSAMTVNAGDGADSVEGGSGDDVLSGDAGADTLDGGAGNDTVFGGTGADVISGGLGDDSLSGGDDQDTFVLEDGFGADTIAGGEGGTDNDTLDTTAVTSGVTVDFSGAEAGTVTDGTDTATFSQMETFDLTDQADTVDGSASTSAMTVNAGDGADTIQGGSGDDVLSGEAGNDTIDGGAGNDTIFGGAGNDVLNGGLGNDTLFGGNDSDQFVMSDGFGSDSIVGGEGGTDNDILNATGLTSGLDITFTDGEAGTLSNGTDTASFTEVEAFSLTSQDDTVDGSAADASMSVYGGDGADSIEGGSQSDVLFGGNGDDTLTGNAGDDTMVGGSGADVLSGGVGDDTLFGGGDQDTIILEDSFGNDSIEAGETGTDSDTIDASAVTSAVDVTFTGDEAGTIENGDDTATFDNVETLILTNSADTVDGSLSTSSMTIEAGDGADTISGGSGDDVLSGEGGNDTIDGGAGNDTVFGGAGADLIDSGAGNDTLFGGDDNDTILLLDGADSNSIDGGSGGFDDDTIDASGLTNGVEVLYTSNEAGGISDGVTTKSSFSEIENLVLTSLSDLVDARATSSSNTIDSGAGDDTILSGSGADILVAGAGADSVDGGAGDDTIFGGAGADSLSGGDGQDDIEGGTGDDTIAVGNGDSASGGDGDDTFIIDDTQAGTGTITIVGGEGNETNGDTLDFNGQLDKGTLVITDDDDAGGGLTGFAFLLDGTRVEFDEIENIICFGRGTKILTATGEMLIEDLTEGDQVVTLDHGLQQIRWIGSREVFAIRDLAPIVISKGVLGNDEDLTVSPQHRMLVSGPKAELLFGEKEVLVPAKHLLSWDGIYRKTGGTVEYFHMLFDSHQVVYANGALSESFHPGESALDAVSQEAKDEILTLFPELADCPTAYGPSARFSLRGYEAEVLGRGMA